MKSRFSVPESLSPSFWKHQRVLLTGGGGFLGSFVADRLKTLSPKVLSVPRRREYDLRDAAAIDRLLGEVKPSLLIHLAAACGGIAANEAEPGRFFYDNALMGIQLMEHARRSGVDKYVQIGTVCSYPKVTPVPFREENLWNGYPEETNAPYGLAKKMLLVQAQAYRKQYGFNAIYLMPANLYGPRDNFDLRTSHVIPALIRKFLEARESGASSIQAWGTGRATREFLYVEDAAEGILMASERYNDPEPVNLGSGGSVSIHTLMKQLSELTEFKGRIRWDGVRWKDGQLRRKLDTSRARRAFGFHARTPLRRGLQKTIDWYRSSR